MEVNREWWDGEARELYVDSTIGATPVITTCPKLEDSIRANFDKYSGVEWDKSICPWKINYKSDFFGGFQWALPYYQTGVDGTTMVQSPLFKERKKGYTFYLSAAGGGYSSLPHEIVDANACTKPLWKTCLSTGETDLTNTDIDYWFNLKYRHIYPVINFDYSRIFVAPMIHNESGSGWVFYDNAQIRADWDPTGVYGISLMFYAKNEYDGSIAICGGLFSLNNKFAQPEWATTNCWKEDDMFDNGLAVAWCNAWKGGYEVGGIQTLGSNTLWGTDPNNPGFADQTFAGPDAAGSVMYFPMKNIMIQSPSDEDSGIWSTDWDHFYMGGGYSQGCKRHLKSTVTYDQFADYLKQQLAYLGFRFCIDGNHLSDAIDSQYYFIPEIDSKGVTTGNYYQANSTEAQNLPNNSWTTDVYQQTPYDGTDDEEEEDPNEYDEDLTTVINHYKGIPVDNTMEYLMTSHALTELIGALGSWVTKANEASLKNNFGTTDPQKLIISVIAYPVDLSDGGWAGQEQLGGGINGITFPNADTQYHPQGSWPNYFPIGRIGIPIKRNATSPAIDDWGYMYLNDNEIIEINRRNSSTIYPIKTLNYYNKNKNFLDYGPYSSAVLQVPYCGSIDISPDDFIGENINCKYIIAPSEGTVKVLVERNDLMVDTLTGTIGTPIDLSGTDVSAKLNAIHQANATIQAQRQKMFSSIATFAAGAAITVATGGSAAPVIMAGLGLASQYQGTKQAIEEANYRIDTAEAPFHQIQAGHGELALTDQAGVRLVIHRPKFLEGYNPEVYGHTVGFATLINSQLKNYHGFTAVNTVDLTGVSCTEEEAQMIKSALKSGVYLP